MSGAIGEQLEGHLVRESQRHDVWDRNNKTKLKHNNKFKEAYMLYQTESDKIFLTTGTSGQVSVGTVSPVL